MNGIQYITAGFVWVGITALGFASGFALAVFADMGDWVIAAGGGIGFVIAVAAVWIMYVRPMQVEARNADYSHLTPLPDDDDDA